MADKHKMDQNSDILENLSPEELQKRIEEDKKQIKESFGLAMTALVAIIAVCIAWFVSNTQVRVTSINIAAQNNMDFELATVGSSPAIDTNRNVISSFLEKLGGLIGDSYFLENQTGTVTSSAHSSIQWNMQSDHQNFANVEGSGQIDGTGDENIGLQPGAYGELQFYIIPKIDGAQTVNCSLYLTPYVDSTKRSGLIETNTNSISFSDDKEVWEITDQRVKHILSGHIYFFMDMNGKMYNTWLEPDENGTLHFSVELEEETKKDDPKLVTIYWNWPTLISQVLLKSGDLYLGGREQLFDEETQDDIVNYMCQTANASFFFSGPNGQEVVVDSNVISEIHKSSWDGTSIVQKNYSTINQPYNNGDQFLGKTVSYVGLELDATN